MSAERTMRAVVVREHGDEDALVFARVPRPALRADEVLLEVRAVAINQLDVWVRKGVPGHVFPLPMIPGCDVSGVVTERGDLVRHVNVGDRVALMPGYGCGTCAACLAGRDHLCRHYGIVGETRDGGYAEAVAVPGANLLAIPDDMGFEEAAAVPLVFLTAWHMLVDRCRLRPGETVLVHAAGSGVGSAAVQIAKLWGATVYATAGGDAKLAKARELGADEGINYTTGDFEKEVRRLTGKRGVDVVVEHVGAATFQGSVRSLAKGGRLVTCGATTGGEATLEIRRVFFKQLSILGSTMGSRAELCEVWEHVKAGRLKPVVDEVFPISRVKDAHRRIARREQFGKVVLVPDFEGALA